MRGKWDQALPFVFNLAKPDPLYLSKLFEMPVSLQQFPCISKGSEHRVEGLQHRAPGSFVCGLVVD